MYMHTEQARYALSASLTCSAAAPLCVVLAPPPDTPLFSPRLEASLPPSVPAVLGAVGRWPGSRVAAVNFLTFMHDRYDALPGATAFVADLGDWHATRGANACAQAAELQAARRVRVRAAGEAVIFNGLLVIGAFWQSKIKRQ